MLIEDVILAVIYGGGGLFILSLVRKIYLARKKGDPIAVAERHKREAQERLEALRVEAEAAKIEREAERTLDRLYEEEPEKEKRRG